MHIWKMSKMEIANNPVLCLFIMLQSVVVLTAIWFGVSIYTTRYEKYDAVHDIMGDRGYVINVDHLYQAGENEDNLICEENEEVEALFPGADVGCIYTVWTLMDYDDVWNRYDPNVIAYDDEIAFCYEPDMAEGRWLEEDDNDTLEVEAVITRNSFGIGVGDELYITTNSIDEPLSQKITVKIVGIVEDNTYIIGSNDNTNDRYEDVRDCYFTYSSEFSNRPYIFFLKDDLRNTENELLGKPAISTMVMGNQFISFGDNLTGEETDYLESVIFSGKCQMNYYMSMEKITKNSKEYIWEQLKEIMPIFVGLLFLVILSVICASAMMTRNQLKNYAVYYVVGLKWKDCIKIQVLQQFILQFVTFLITTATFMLLVFSGRLNDTLFDVGFEQIIACIIYASVCVAVSAIMPFKIINNNTPKHILTSN